MNQKRLGLMSVLFSTFMLLAVPTAEAQRNRNRPPLGMRGQQAQGQQGGQGQFGPGQGGQDQGGMQQQVVQQVMNEFDQDGNQMLDATELGQMLAAMHHAMMQQGQGNQQGQNQGQQQGLQGGQRAGLQGGQQRGGGGPGRARGGQGRPGG